MRRTDTRARARAPMASGSAERNEQTCQKPNLSRAKGRKVRTLREITETTTGESRGSLGFRFCGEGRTQKYKDRNVNGTTDPTLLKDILRLFNLFFRKGDVDVKENSRNIHQGGIRGPWGFRFYQMGEKTRPMVIHGAGGRERWVA